MDLCSVLADLSAYVGHTNHSLQSLNHGCRVAGVGTIFFHEKSREYLGTGCYFIVILVHLRC